MYTVYAGDRIIYHPELVDNGYAIYDPVVTLEANKSGSFQFTMPVTNVNYNNLQKMSTIITVMNDGDEIFRGRILNDERDFNNNKVVYCEGELAFLLDSIVRPYDYDGTIRGFFGYLVANHNTQVESYKQFTVGDVTVLPDTSFKLSITDYVSTWNMLNTYLLDLFGGYIRVRLENGLRYLDYVASYENTNTQVVAFGTNMLDLSQYVSAEQIFTNLIPLGSTYAVELDDSEITVGQLSKTFTEPIGKKNESSTPFVFALEVLLNSKSKANGTSNITVKYSVKTKDNSTASWSGLDGTKVYADIQLDPGIQGVARVNQKVALPAKTINGTEQVLVTWTGNVATGSLVITGEFINNYTKSTAAAGYRPISNSMATVSQLLQQKYLKTTIATVNNNLDYLTDATAEGLFGKIVAVHTWDDVDDPTELKSLGEQYLADNISMAVKLDVNAVDLNLLNVAYEKFKIGDRIRVVSAPHVLDDYFTCTRITLDLQHPDNNTYRLGREFKTLTETQITAAKDIQVTNEMIAQINNSLDAAESVVEQMNQLINTIYDKYADVTTVINNLDAAYADIDFANIQDAAIANLVANNALITALNAAYAQIDLANISNATIETLMSKQATIDALDASFATINFANITDAAINNLLAKQVLTDYLETNFLQADGANIGSAVIDVLKVGGLADINFANITQAAINHLVAGDATIQGLDANFADINFANITNTAINNALVNTGLFSSLTVEDDVIVGGTLAADSIAAGSIVADKLVVRGTDGLYYQLNVAKKNDGSISQSDWNALTQAELTSAFHGENIIANSITAKQIHAGTITAEKLATLDASQVTFNNGGTNTTMATFISDINGLTSNVSTITTKVNASVTSYSYRYYKNTSATQHPTDAQFDSSSGSDTMPAREDGKYIWRRTVRTKNDGTTTPPIYEMVQGADGATGPQGPKGNDAIQYYTYIRYSANSNGSSMTPTPQSNTKYIGVYIGTSSAVPGYTSFTWSKYVGDPGSPGTPGSSSYTHIRYSANSDGSNMTDTPSSTTVYVGIYVGTSSTAPTTASSYTWSKYVGDKGDKGDKGDTGNTGRPGSQIWTTTTAPTVSNSVYTFTISNLTGNTAGATIKVGDLIFYSYYRYTVTSVGSTTVQAGSRQNLRGAQGAGGATGPQGVSVTKVEPIYYLNDTETAPAIPSTKVTTSSTRAKVWSLTPATYIANYKYYTCEQVTFSDASVGYSDPVLATELNNVHVSIDEINVDINQTKESILLKVDTETYEANYEFLNGEISDLQSTTESHSSSIATLQEGIALKVSSSQVQSQIDSATSQLKTDIKNLQSSALTINSEGITSLVTRVNTLEQVAEGSALKVKADGTYIYKGVADASGNVTLDENNYTKIDTAGSHTISNNKEVTWNTADGTGTPKLSIGSSSADVQRWTFSMDGDLLNIRWIDS